MSVFLINYGNQDIIDPRLYTAASDASETASRKHAYMILIP